MHANTPGRDFSADSFQRASPSCPDQTRKQDDRKPQRPLTQEEWDFVLEKSRLWAFIARRYLGRIADHWIDQEIVNLFLPTIARAVVNWVPGKGMTRQSYVCLYITREIRAKMIFKRIFPAPKCKLQKHKYRAPNLLGDYVMHDWIKEEEEKDNTEQLEAVRAWIERLHPSRRKYINFIYGGSSPQVKTLQQAATEFGVSRERVRQIVGPCLAKLRELLGYPDTGARIVHQYSTRSAVIYKNVHTTRLGKKMARTKGMKPPPTLVLKRTGKLPTRYLQIKAKKHRQLQETERGQEEDHDSRGQAETSADR